MANKKFQSIKTDKINTPLYGSLESDRTLPKDKLNKTMTQPRIAYDLIKDFLLDEGIARMNLATFCQTYMEKEAVQLMTDCLPKNAIDKSEYPQTTEVENRCVKIIGDLWNAPNSDLVLGTSTIGSSEACMLGGMAMKFAWRDAANKLKIDINKKRPNIIISSGFQVCWEKFGVYWDVDLKCVPVDEKNMSMDPKKAMALVDEYTIGVVAILGITYTGKFDDVKSLNALVNEYNKKYLGKRPSLGIHVDAASGGLFTPFIDKNLIWDFRLNNVISINSSGHKYGLVYPGIGWVLWRDKKYVPEKLIFKVSYLGGELPTMAINFSHSAANIIGQYYNFVRYGYEGYHLIHQRTKDVALYIANEIKKLKIFEILNDGANVPVVCWKIRPDSKRKWNLYDLADKVRINGWQLPAYPLPSNLQDVIVQRAVIRSDFSREFGELLIRDFKIAIDELNKTNQTNYPSSHIKHGFTH